MEQEQIIIDFLEGNLSQHEEQELFSMLSFDNALREEFKSYLKIEKTIANSSAAFQPSSGSTASLFSKLGYSFPAPAPVQVPIKSLSTRIIAAKGTLISYAAVALITSLLTLAGSFLLKPSGSGSSNPHPPAVRKDLSQPLSSQNYSSLPAIKEKTVIKYIYVPSADEYRKKDEENRNIGTGGDISFCLPENQTLTKFPKLQASSKYDIPENSTEINNSGYNSPHEKTGLSIGVRHSFNWFLQKETISPKRYSPFNNFGISCNYSLNNYLKLGMDIRQETFFVRYDGFENAKAYFYEQQPNLTTFSLSGRYEFGNIIGLTPFCQLSAGGNRAGFVPRFNIGSIYSPYEGLAFVFELDYSAIFFRHDNKLFNASKAGVNLGVEAGF